MLHIRYFGSIRSAAQKSGEDMEFIPDIAIYQLLEQLSRANGEAFRGELFLGNELRDDLTVTWNGSIIKHEDAKKIKLKQDDTLTLFPLFPGGG